MRRNLFLLMLTFCMPFLHAQNADWPSFTGPNYNFTGTPTGTYLLKDLSFAKLKWISEEHDMGRGKYATTEDDGSNTGISPGGYASPVIYDGMVYVPFYRGTGMEYDVSMYNAAVANSETPTPDFYRIRANDYMVAVNMETGTTVWKKEKTGGMNIWMEKRAGWAVTPVAFGGKVFHLTTQGELYAYDAKTGTELWQATNGINRSMMQSELSSALANEDVNKGSINYVFGMVEADGILCVGDYGTGLYGIDTADGSELWHKTGVRRGCATPTIVPVSGKDYVLVANENGQLTLIDPVTGINEWQVTSVGGHALTDIPYTIVNYKDVAIITVDSVDCTSDKIAGVRITTGGPQLLYVLPGSYLRTVKWDSGPRPMHTAKDSVVYYSMKGEAGNKLVLFDVYTGEIYHEKNGGDDAPMIIEDRLIYGHDLYHAPGNSNSFSMYMADPDNFEKLGGWTPPHRNNGGYDQPLMHPYADGKMVFRSAVNYPTETVGGDLRCYDIEFYPQVFSSFEISPESASLLIGDNQQYSYTAKDQAGITMEEEPQVTWSVSEGGSIDTNGLLTAGNKPGAYKAYATAVHDSVTLKDTIIFYVKSSQSISCYEFDSVYYLHNPFPLQCTASSGLPVQYERISGPFSISNDSVFLAGAPGTAYISVKQSGNDYYSAAPDRLITFVISLSEPDDVIYGIDDDMSEVSDDIIVYPNPSDGEIFIKNEKAFVSDVEIYNILGELIEKKSNVNMINISLKGMYILKIDDSLIKVIIK